MKSDAVGQTTTDFKSINSSVCSNLPPTKTNSTEHSIIYPSFSRITSFIFIFSFSISFRKIMIIVEALSSVGSCEYSTTSKKVNLNGCLECHLVQKYRLHCFQKDQRKVHKETGHILLTTEVFDMFDFGYLDTTVSF